MPKEKIKLISNYLRYMADAFEKQMNDELDDNQFDLRQAFEFIINEVESWEEEIDYTNYYIIFIKRPVFSLSGHSTSIGSK